MTFRGVTNEELQGKKNTPEFHQECLELIKDTPLKMRESSTLTQKIYDWPGTYIEFINWVDIPKNSYLLGTLCRCDSTIISSEGYEFELLYDMHYGPQLILQSYPK